MSNEDYSIIARPKDYLFIALFFLAWAIKDVFVKLALDHIRPIELTLLISAFVTISCSLTLSLQRFSLGKPTVKKIMTAGMRWRLLALSVTTAAAFFFTVTAIDRVGPFAYSITDLVAYTTFLIWFSSTIVKERIPKSIVAALVFAGIGFMLFHWAGIENGVDSDPWGILATLISSFFWAISLIIAKFVLTNGITPLQLVFYRFLLLGIVGIALFPEALEEFSPQLLGLLALLGLFGYAVPFVFFFKGLKNVPTTAIAIFVTSGPLLTAFFAWVLIPDTSFNFVHIVGAIIVALAIAYTIIVSPSS